MIKRYSRKELSEIWEEKNKYQTWLEIEIAAAQAMEKLKIIEICLDVEQKCSVTWMELAIRPS